MRTVIVLALLLAPAAAIAYHYGPGQGMMALDKASSEIQAAQKQMEAGNPGRAVEHFEAAIALLPGDRADLRQRLRLERAKAQLLSGGLAEAYDEIVALSEEVSSSASTSAPNFVSDLRKTQADAQYYMTWLQRLEGEPRETWEPDIEAARQNYKLLAENEHAAGNTQQAATLEADLESAIRLARLDLSELQALPLPKQCQGCCSGKCKSKCKGVGKRPGERKTEDARGAGGGPPPDEKGS